jgi:hypothetical protein
MALLISIAAIPACRQEPDIPPSIQEVKAKHASQLLERPGVVSVGLGRDEEGNPAIIVGMEASHPQTEAQLPQSLEGYPVIIRVIGPVKAQ